MGTHEEPQAGETPGFDGFTKVLESRLPADSILLTELTDQELREANRRANLVSSGEELRDLLFDKLCDMPYEWWADLICLWYGMYPTDRDETILQVLSKRLSEYSAADNATVKTESQYRNWSARVGLLLAIHAEASESLLKNLSGQRSKLMSKRRVCLVEAEQRYVDMWEQTLNAIRAVRQFSQHLEKEAASEHAVEFNQRLEHLEKVATIGRALSYRDLTSGLKESIPYVPPVSEGRTKHVAVRKSVVALMDYLQLLTGPHSWYWSDMEKVFEGGCLNLKQKTAEGWRTKLKQSAE